LKKLQWQCSSKQSEKKIKGPISFLISLLIIPLLFSMTLAAGNKHPDGEKVYGEVKSDKALIYFIRPSIGDTSGNWIFEDDQLLTYTVESSYSFVYAEPGRHLIWFSKDALVAEHEIELIPGQTYYISVGYEFCFLNEEAGKMLINKVLTYIEVDNSVLKIARRKVEEYYPIAQKEETEKEKATMHMRLMILCYRNHASR